MTERAKKLRGAVAAAVGPGKVDKVLRAIVAELGISDDMEHDLRAALAALLEAAGDE